MKTHRRTHPYDSQGLKEADTEQDVSMAGIVSALKEITTRRGDRMAAVTRGQ